MFIGQIIVYRFNGLHNSKPDVERNLFTLKDIRVETGDKFRETIMETLDQIKPGEGYALVKWNSKMFICEKDTNNPEIDYVRHSVGYHPLADKFTI